MPAGHGRTRGGGFFVYIIRLKGGALYVGQTRDLGGRMRQHQRGIGSRFVRSQGFDSLEYFEARPTRSSAMRREREIKRRGRRYKEGLVGSSVFSYGTLRDPRRLRRLLGRDVNAVDATLGGYTIVGPTAETLGRRELLYPFAVRKRGSSVVGKLLLGLTEKDLSKLDKFEGKAYRRTKVAVGTPWGKKRAYAYVRKDTNRVRRA